jgi:hypothetical protein
MRRFAPTTQLESRRQSCPDIPEECTRNDEVHVEAEKVVEDHLRESASLCQDTTNVPPIYDSGCTSMESA